MHTPARPRHFLLFITFTELDRSLDEHGATRFPEKPFPMVVNGQIVQVLRQSDVREVISVRGGRGGIHGPNSKSSKFYAGARTGRRSSTPMLKDRGV
jgi:hypothetical protein